MLFLEPCTAIEEPGFKFWSGGTTLFNKWNHGTQTVTGPLSFEQCNQKAFETDAAYITYQENDRRCICKASDAILSDSEELSSAYVNTCYSYYNSTPTPIENNIVTMRKGNALNFGIDGNQNGANGQDIYLWRYNQNQQWEEIDRGNGYYSYQRQGTNFCIDGGNGGANGQNVYLWSCTDTNQNQHWRKVDIGDGKFRLEKRNAPGYSIDGNRGAGNGQSIYLWASNDRNENQQWLFTSIKGDDLEATKETENTF